MQLAGTPAASGQPHVRLAGTRGELQDSWEPILADEFRHAMTDGAYIAAETCMSNVQSRFLE